MGSCKWNEAAAGIGTVGEAAFFRGSQPCRHQSLRCHSGSIRTARCLSASPALLPLLLSSLVLTLLFPLAEARPAGFTECHESKILAKWPAWLSGWPGGCLRRHNGSAAISACNSSCLEDVKCSAWQWRPDFGCLWAQDRASEGVECYDSGQTPSSATNQYQGALVLHGSAASARDLGTGKEVKGLLNIGPLGGADQAEEVARCKLLCYASSSCGAWQFGDGDCFIERGSSPIDVKANLTTDSDLAAVMVAGEEVRRGCPHTPHPVWLVMGSVDFAIGLLALLWALCSGTGPTREDPFRKANCWSGPAACLCPTRATGKTGKTGTGSGTISSARSRSSKTCGAMSGTSSSSSAASCVSSVSNSRKEDLPQLCLNGREVDTLDNNVGGNFGYTNSIGSNSSTTNVNIINRSDDSSEHHNSSGTRPSPNPMSSAAGYSSPCEDVMRL